MVEIVFPIRVVAPLSLKNLVSTNTGIVAEDVFHSHLNAVCLCKRICIVNLRRMLISARVVDTFHPVSVGIVKVCARYVGIGAFIFAVVGVAFKTIRNGEHFFFFSKTTLVVGGYIQ